MDAVRWVRAAVDAADGGDAAPARRAGAVRASARLAAAVVAALVVATGLVAAPPGAPAEAAVPTSLELGQTLYRGQSLTSPSGRWNLRLDQEGWLSLEETAHRLGSAFPTEVARGIDRVELTADGNLRYIATNGYIAFQTLTAGRGVQRLVLDDQRDLALVAATGQVVRSLGTQRRGLLEHRESLLPGDVVLSPDRRTRLVMQADGNLVLYREGRALWSTGTAGHPGAGAVLQRDGNLVVYAAPEQGGRALAQTGAFDVLRVYPLLRVENFELSLVNHSYGPALWGTAWRSSTLEAGDSLQIGDRRTSPGGACQVVLQGDWNVVQYCGGRAVWSTGTHWSTDGYVGEGVRLSMQGDGNLVMAYPPGWGASSVRWWSGTNAPGSRLVVQADGNVVVYAPSGAATWSRMTGRLR